MIDPDRREELILAETPQPDPMLTESRISPLAGGALLVVAGFLTFLTLYAVTRPPEQPQLARAPAPGATPVPESPALTTTGQGVPQPGDRATGTVASPAPVPPPPPPLRPGRPVADDPNPLPSTVNQPPPDHPPVPPGR
jgi:hypothetical protein